MAKRLIREPCVMVAMYFVRTAANIVVYATRQYAIPVVMKPSVVQPVEILSAHIVSAPVQPVVLSYVQLIATLAKNAVSLTVLIVIMFA